ncbi:random slug protein 5-like [Chenopodium quinoa]|uniref:random slug protein 5-like n=1 Tax=Chenopodium quinoa TaxID=63459 RepID=UPI000B792ED5|nr:random slug protein 5-like [Chenopodium quinoa]XP_021740158.1 random slug protein 5-like [Chenopodium quinoa]
MSTNLKKTASNAHEQSLPHEEQLKKIGEVRAAISPIPEKLSKFCSDDLISRYLRARNWNVKKATKMLKDSLKWRLEYKPEHICWEDVACEADSGKVYRSTSVDKEGRPVLVMRPSCQNTRSVSGQIKYLVYCMENAILNLPPNQEQMVWLVDFWNFNLTNISVKSAKETAHVLQNHYPERLGVAVLYNPPKFFEQFYKLVKPFLEPKTRKKVKFVYADDENSKKIMEELFDMDQLESAFGGNSSEGFDIQKYAQRMKEDDEKNRSYWEEGNDASVAPSRDGLIHESSESHNNDPTEEEDSENDGRCTPSSSTAEDSQSSTPDADLSVANMSLEDPEHMKA